MLEILQQWWSTVLVHIQHSAVMGFGVGPRLRETRIIDTCRSARPRNLGQNFYNYTFLAHSMKKPLNMWEIKCVMK